MKKIIIIISVVVFTILLLIAYLLINGGSIFGPGFFPVPTTAPGSEKNGVNEDYNKSFEKLIPTIESSEEKETKIGAVLNQLPYKGKNFSLYFDLDTGRYVLYINPSNKDLGNTEFEDFLKKNGVLSRYWLQNLFIMYITPTPTAFEATTTPAP